MIADLILSHPDISVLLIESRGSSEFVVGVPHHAPLGKETLPCAEHDTSDENSGVLGRYLAALLNCHSVIASNYILDSNKTEYSDYYKVIYDWKPTILVEIHGHGGKKAEFDLEISSGSEKMSKWSQELSGKLREMLAQAPSLKNYCISGDFSKINFKATKSKTITSDQWLAFHLELPKSLRSSKSQYTYFCEVLANALQDSLVKYRGDKIGDAVANPTS